MEASRRHETPRSEAKHFITPSIANSMRFISASVLVTPSPSPIGVKQNSPGGCCAHMGLSHSWETLSLGIQIFYQANLPKLCLSGQEDVIFTILDNTQPCPLIVEDASLIFQCSLLYKVPWKGSPTEKLSVPLFPRHAKAADTHETLSPNNDRWRQCQS